MSTYKSTSRTAGPRLLKIVVTILAVIVVAAVLIFLLKQVQIHLTDGGQGSSEGGTADSSSTITR